jgi:sarcosine oxidase subunit delta
VHHGDAAPRRPQADEPDAAFHDYVYLRDNPAGPCRELWFHAAGCHSWLVVERDTRTHEIRSVTFARGDA